ncbi:putative RNA binding protein [Corchorus capsularis]|uniref:Putative RNA binding protein n=1 Tax=Corchorus capsularis TaxID=210143 RepID=A0A1R3ITQ8_COCAP|nr:putative RNA binding protein [Corchorus capsularis]
MASSSLAKNLFAVLDGEEDDELVKPSVIKKGATSLPVSKKKKQLQKQQAEKEQSKNKKPLNPEGLRAKAKPLILPDHVLSQQKVIRRPKPKPIATANGQVQAADHQQENIEAEKPKSPQNLTLKEYEEGLLGNNKKGFEFDDQRKPVNQDRTLNINGKGFESMKLVGKKRDDSFSVKKEENSGKKFIKSVDGKKDNKSININEFLKPVNDNEKPSANYSCIKSISGAQEVGHEKAAPRIDFGDFDQFPVLHPGARKA